MVVGATEPEITGVASADVKVTKVPRQSREHPRQAEGTAARALH